MKKQYKKCKDIIFLLKNKVEERALEFIYLKAANIKKTNPIYSMCRCQKCMIEYCASSNQKNYAALHNNVIQLTNNAEGTVGTMTSCRERNMKDRKRKAEGSYLEKTIRNKIEKNIKGGAVHEGESSLFQK